jgi:dihydrofolate reductase
MGIGLVWAQSRGGVIGADGGLPWHLPEDLAHFRAITHGGAVIMGRRTWDALPHRFRPLPGRSNIVITRARDWTAPGASAVHSFDDALALAVGPIWVIGGAEIFRLALPYADTLEITEIDEEFAGDTFAPALDAAWNRVTNSTWRASSEGLRYRFVRYAPAPAIR